MARNKYGQVTSNKPIVLKITKSLQEIAKEAEIRVKPLMRDKLKSTLRSEIYASYRPATEKGKETQEYNKSHKHQKSRPYHHTGLLVSRVDAVIEGNTVKAIIRDGEYDNGATTEEVYDYLKFGTPDKPTKSDVYDYADGTKFSQYISQEPHNFEARTREQMKAFTEELVQNINSESWRKANGLDKYIDKVARKNR